MLARRRRIRLDRRPRFSFDRLDATAVHEAPPRIDDRDDDDDDARDVSSALAPRSRRASIEASSDDARWVTHR
jgi:hypothetical protein